MYDLSPDVSLYQYYMIVLQTFGVHYAQRYTLIGRVCRNICSIIDGVYQFFSDSFIYTNTKLY